MFIHSPSPVKGKPIPSQGFESVCSLPLFLTRTTTHCDVSDYSQSIQETQHCHATYFLLSACAAKRTRSSSLFDNQRHAHKLYIDGARIPTQCRARAIRKQRKVERNLLPKTRRWEMRRRPSAVNFGAQIYYNFFASINTCPKFSGALNFLSQ